jgi:hypothetical protein
MISHKPPISQLVWLPALALLAACVGYAEPPPAASIVFVGMCDASAAAAVDADRFIVADDEDNSLRVYARTGGAALSEFDLSSFLGNQGTKKAKEADLEAAAQLGDHVFWIASHGRNSKGKEAPERQRLFATKVSVNGSQVEVAAVGQPYRSLLKDLTRHPPLANYELEEAAQLAPKALGGLNIEGLASTPEGHLLIGFRNPVREGKALVVPLHNPMKVITGQSAEFGTPIVLDLQGHGIRSLERFGSGYVIIAGATGDSREPSKLFKWDGRGRPHLVPRVTLSGLNPEGIAFRQHENGGEFLILSDDGTQEVGGMDCKDLKDPALKRFRGRMISF